MPVERRSPRSRKKRRQNPLGAMLAFFFICGALLLGISVFFKISVIKVEGNTRYTADQVSAASGIKMGDNLFFVNKFDAITKIFRQLPYAEKITVKRDLPNVIVINVTDGKPLASIQEGDAYWLVDKSCKLLEKAGSDKIAGTIAVTGVVLSHPEAGAKLKLSDSLKEAYLTSLIDELSKKSMLEGVSKIDLTSVGDAKFYYLNRFTVRLGNNEDIQGKLKLLLDSIESKRINSAATGTIDLSRDNEAHFISD